MASSIAATCCGGPPAATAASSSLTLSAKGQQIMSGTRTAAETQLARELESLTAEKRRVDLRSHECPSRIFSH